jgi:hypothetical protein
VILRSINDLIPSTYMPRSSSSSVVLQCQKNESIIAKEYYFKSELKSCAKMDVDMTSLAN